MSNSTEIKSVVSPASARQRKLIGALFVFLSAVSWGFSGCIAQFLTQNCAVSVGWLNSVRMVGTAVLLLPAALIMPSTRREIKCVLTNRTDLRRIIIYAIFGAFACQLGYLYTIAYTNSGTATMMEQLGLVIIMVYTCMTGRRLPTLREVLALLLALGGVFCICTKGQIGTLALSPEGLGWGIFAAIAMATYVMLPVKLLEKYKSLTVTSLAMIIGGAFVCCVFQPWNSVPELTFEVVLGTFGTIILGTVVAYLLFLEGVRRVGAVVGGLLDAVEPVTAMIVSAVWLGTVMTGFDVLGCVFIVSMMVLVTLPGKA